MSKYLCLIWLQFAALAAATGFQQTPAVENIIPFIGINVDTLEESFPVLYGKKKTDVCLTDDEESDVKEMVEIVSNILSTFSKWIRQTEDEVNSKIVKKALEKLGSLFDKENDLISQNTEKQLDAACVRCSKVTKLAFNSLVKLEGALNKFFPVWKDFNILVKISEEFDKVFEGMKQICPFTPDTLEAYNMHQSIRKEIWRKLEVINLNEIVFQIVDKAETHNVDVTKLSVTSFSLETSCKDILIEIDTFSKEILDLIQNTPVLDKIPFMATLEKYLHLLFTEAKNLCPSTNALESPACVQISNNPYFDGFNKVLALESTDATLNQFKKMLVSVWPEEGVCFSCSKVLADFDGMLLEFEAYLAKKVPFWKELVYVRAAFKMADMYLKMMGKMCPNYESVKLDELLKATSSLENFDRINAQSTFLNVPFKVEHDCVEAFNRLEVVALVEKDFQQSLYLLQIYHNLAEMCPLEAYLSKQAFDELTCFTDDVSVKLHENTKRFYDKFAGYIGVQPDMAVSSKGLMIEKVQYFGFSVRYLSDSGNAPVCASCLSIVKEIEAAVSYTEKMMSKFLPGWDAIPPLPQIDNLLHLLLDEVYKRCPRSVERLNRYKIVQKYLSKDCITPEDKKMVKQLTDTVDTGFQVIISQIDELEEITSNSDVKHVLDAVKNYVKEINTNLDANINSASEDLCASCEEVVHTIKHAFDALEKFLDSSIPNWRSNPILSTVVKEIKENIDSLSVLCPNKVSTPVALELTSTKKGGCLPDEDKEKLYNISDYMETGLQYAAKLVRIYAKFQFDPAKRYSLEKAADVMDAVAEDVVANLTKLADEFCGSCADEVDAIKDVVVVLEDTMFDVEPMWKQTHIYDAVVAITNSVFEKLETYCDPSANEAAKPCNHHKSLRVISDESCMTKEEEEQFKYYAEKFHEALSYGAEILRVYAGQVTDKDEREKYEFIAKVLESISDDIVTNIAKVFEQPCATCSEVVEVAKDVEKLVEKTMSDVDADWRKNPEYKRILLGIDAIISMAEGLCPS